MNYLEKFQETWGVPATSNFTLAYLQGKLKGRDIAIQGNFMRGEKLSSQVYMKSHDGEWEFIGLADEILGALLASADNNVLDEIPTGDEE